MLPQGHSSSERYCPANKSWIIESFLSLCRSHTSSATSLLGVSWAARERRAHLSLVPLPVGISMSGFDRIRFKSSCSASSRKPSSSCRRGSERGESRRGCRPASRAADSPRTAGRTSRSLA
eukprot:352209-Hanusia_phi.AAC.11